MIRGSLSMEGTDSSISEWDLMKFNVTSGSVCESLTHCPGRGSGTYTKKKQTKKKLKLNNGESGYQILTGAKQLNQK